MERTTGFEPATLSLGSLPRRRMNKREPGSLHENTPPEIKTVAPLWRAGDTIPLGRRTL